MAITNRVDPYLNFRFLVEIECRIVAGFSDVSGLDVQIDTEEYQEGGVNYMVHQLPKGVRNSKLVLKRGITDCDFLWRWQQDMVAGKIRRDTIKIILHDTEGNEKQCWRCLQAHPVQWTGPELQGTGNTVAIETLELVHQGITKG
jgi:phage tail-like protein